MVRRSLLLLLAALLMALTLACSASADPEAGSSGGDTSSGPVATASGRAQARLEPPSGRPGTEITVTGSGFAPRSELVLTAEGSSSQAYTTVTTRDDGSFMLRFRLDKTPAGGELSPGRFDLILRSSSNEVRLPFLIEPPRGQAGGGSGGSGG